MNTKKITLIGILGALTLALTAAENMLVLPIPIAGAKIGFANIAIMAALGLFQWPVALGLVLFKSLGTLLFFGGTTAFLYSLCGGMLAFGCMLMAHRSKRISMIGVGVIGAAANSTGQTILACLILGNIHIINYLWVLLAISIITGIFTGLVSHYVTNSITSYVRGHSTGGF